MEPQASPPDGSYTGSFGGMAADASRATKAYADVTREKVAAETKSEGQMVARGEEDRARALEAYKREGIKPEEFKPWNAEIEHKKFESDPIQGFGSTGAVFAMIASAFTKAPMLSALEGMTGALTAIKDGNEASYTRAYETYKQNIQTAKDRHQIEHQAYTDALALGTHDLQLSEAKLRAEAARFGDKQLLALAENGMVKEIYDTIAARNRAMETSADLADKTTIRTLQDQQLKTSFAQIDAAKGPPGSDGQPTEIPPAVKAAQKLRLINTVLMSGKMTSPQQIAVANMIMENPTMSAEELTKKLEQSNIIRQPAQRAADIEKNAIMERARKLVEDNPNLSTTEAIGQARTEASKKRVEKYTDVALRDRAEQLIKDNPNLSRAEAIGRAASDMKPDSKTAAAVNMQQTIKRAEELRQEDPELSETEAFNKAKRQMAVESSAPSGNRMDDLRKNYDQADNAIKKSEKVLTFLEKHAGAAGIVGKIMRGEEIAENIAGISTKSDRAQMRRDIMELKEIVPRIITEANGRPLKSAQEHIDAIVAGLNAGDTGPNTRRAFRELLVELKKRKADFSGRITTGFDPDKPSSGAPDAGEAPDPAKPQPHDWLKLYPKKP